MDVEFKALRMHAEVFGMAQANRIALYNKLGLKADGKPKIKLGNETELDPFWCEHMAAHSKLAENEARKAMVKAYQTIVPEAIQEWQASHKGIGEHSLAKLLGCTGHPYIAVPHVWEHDDKGKQADTPTALDPFYRSLGDLRAYCGMGAAIKKTKGMSQDQLLKGGNPRAKTAIYLIVEGIVKTGGSVYRDYYDEIKETQQYRLTEMEWSKAHLNNHAIRLTGKKVLKDLYNIAKNDFVASHSEHR